MRGRSLAFRVDAGPLLGVGHLSQCFHLARGLRGELGVEPHFLVTASTLECAMIPWIVADGCKVSTVSDSNPHREDPDRTRELLERLEPAAIVVDLLTPDASDRDLLTDPHLERVDVPKYVSWLRSQGLPVVRIAYDAGAVCSDADLLLALHPAQLAVSYASDGRLRGLGPSYFSIDPDMARYRDVSRQGVGTYREQQRVVVSFGGSDPDGMTSALAAAIQANRKVDVHVVVGPGNPIDADALGHLGVVVHRSPRNLAELFASADVVVSAAGHTLFELAFLGVPAICSSTRERQEACARYFAEQGSALHLGRVGAVRMEQVAGAVERLLADPSKRERMRRIGRQLVDGRGAERVASALREVWRGVR